jgi:hypothetical protein
MSAHYHYSVEFANDLCTVWSRAARTINAVGQVTALVSDDIVARKPSATTAVSVQRIIVVILLRMTSPTMEPYRSRSIYTKERKDNGGAMLARFRRAPPAAYRVNLWTNSLFR